MRFAADGTAFTDELSERNTEFILCNSFFFAAFSGPTSPFSSKPWRDYLPDPTIKQSPARRKEF
jgi:hypothetical protein